MLIFKGVWTMNNGYLTPQQRVECYSKIFPHYAPLIVHHNRIYGCWVVGALFRRKQGYYGEFPHSVHERILALFPDCKKPLYLFSGTTHPLIGITWDINPKLKPDICDDIRNLKAHADELGGVDLIIVDPPYEKKDFEKYGQKPFNKSQVLKDLYEVTASPCYIAWLDLIVPIYSKKQWKLLGHIGMVVSTNTRIRVLNLWERGD